MKREGILKRYADVPRWDWSDAVALTLIRSGTCARHALMRDASGAAVLGDGAVVSPVLEIDRYLFESKIRHFFVAPASSVSLHPVQGSECASSRCRCWS